MSWRQGKVCNARGHSERIHEPDPPLRKRGGKRLRQALWVLAFLVVCWGISSWWLRLRAPGSPTPFIPAASSTIIADTVPPDLIPARAEITLGQSPSPFRFTDIAKEAGIDFVHVSGMTDAKHFPTAYGSGAAMFDFDNDGRLDLYFATMTYLPVGIAKTGPNRLYRNLGNGRFEEATAERGLGLSSGFCHGITVGDIDNDGDQDVFLSNFGPERVVSQ